MTPPSPPTLPSEIDYSLLGAKILEKRTNESLSLRDAATQSGISYSTLSRLERGTAQPDLATLMRVLAWLDLPPSSLLKGRTPVLAHLRAQKNLVSVVADAIAEVVPIARAKVGNMSSADRQPPVPKIYRRLRSSQREEFAGRFRNIIKYDLDSALNPFALEVVGVQVKYVDGLGVPAGSLRVLTGTHKSAWSAITLPLNTDQSDWLIVLNPTHTIERQRVTLMEEICHILLGHQLTTLSHIEGQTFRDYNKEQESDAYGLGAAILVPKRPLLDRIRKGGSAADIAQHFGVSTELVEYRTKITGAWYEYKLQQDVKIGPPS